MAPLVARGASLAEAYERCCWGDPALRQQLIADQQAAAIARSAQEAKEQADRARRARTPATRGSTAQVADGADDRDFKEIFAAELAAA